MKRIALLASLTALLAACGDPNHFRNGIPGQETVKLLVPAQAGQPLTSVQQGLVGQTAAFYVFTRQVSGWLNGATVWTLGLVKTITDYPATSIKGDTAVWGPWTDSLSPNTYKMTVTKTAENTYTYALEGKAKTAADSAFVVVLSGTHVVSLDANGQPQKGFGAGSFLIDWDKMQTLPEHDTNVGTAEFAYSHASAASDMAVNITFTQVLDQKTGKRINASYAYVKKAGNGGKFQFSTDSDITGGAALEHMAIESRWQESGAGRSDVRATGGDLGANTATVNECWDTNFASQYLNASFDPSKNYGTESTACVFTPAEYSTL